MPGADVVSIITGFVGHCYKFGGAPGKDGGGCWDCSSCVNYVFYKAGMKIPGGKYNPETHGPSSIIWMNWKGAATVGHRVSHAQPGDLCIWQTHMGICVAPGRMISALNPVLKTRETPIIGPPGEVLFVRRPLGESLPANELSFIGGVGSFFKDLTSADLWERVGLGILGFILIVAGILILAAPTATKRLKEAASITRGLGAFGSSESGEPSDSSGTLDIAERQAAVGERNLSINTMREKRLSGGAHDSGSPEPNPAPKHS